MMNKRIRSMIDAIFAEMKMTAENLALRDELMANAQARYEDMIARGKTEEEAFAQVAASLEDVQALLEEMNPKAEAPEQAPEAAQEPEAPKTGPQEEPGAAAQDPLDLGDALNKAFTALGGWGQSIMPQARKIARQMDDATGGVLRDIGRAVNQSMRDAQKAAGDVIDRMQQDKAADVQVHDAQATSEELREEAKDLRAQADLKRAVGDAQGAAQLDAQADALETQADARDQLDAMEQAQRSAQAQTGEPKQEEKEAPAQEEAERPVYGADGEIDEDAFAQSVEQMSCEAEKIVREAGDALGEAASKAGEAIEDAVYGKRDPQGKEARFPVAGLRKIDIALDADDVTIEPADGEEIVVRWTARNVEGEPAISMNDHTLTIRRKNPDVFKTFFSVFSKNGGQITVLVPRGYAADYAVGTTSGDVTLRGVDVDDVQVATTSGDVRVEPDTGIRAKDIKTETISGDATISAMAIEIAAKSVSGNVFISCDAQKVGADVVSGRLHIEGACDEWDVDSVSGRAELVCTVVPGGKIKADTISADLTLCLPSSIRGFAVEFESMSGKLTNEFGPDRYGTCALPIHLDTLSGRMLITRL